MHDPALPHRRYDIDALRVFAFALLILYHVGMFYVADWGWHVKSVYLAEWLQYPMIAVNRWRMSLLFLVSGLAVNFLLRRSSAGGFAWSRTKRLLIPLVFGMLMVVPPQAYFQALSNGAFNGSYAQFLIAYFTFQPWPAGAFDGSHIGITWNHLWYLPYLLTYTLLLAAFLPVLNSTHGRRLRAWFRGLRGLKLVLLPVLPLTVATWLLSSYPSTHDLFSDWHNHAIYFTVFIYGYWIGAEGGFWSTVKRCRWPLLIAALAACAAHLFLNRYLSGSAATWQHAAYDFFRYLYLWSALLAILGWGYRLLNRPFGWLTYATESVYPWYILHQTITVVAGYQLSRFSLGPVVEPALVIAATIIGCLVLNEYVIRRVDGLRPLFGLKRTTARRPSPAPAHELA